MKFATGRGAPALSPLAQALRALGLLGLPLMLAPAAAIAQSGTAAVAPQQLERVEVISVSPLPGQGIDRELLPYSTQTLRRDRIDRANSDNLVDFMNRNLPGVQVNDIQGSPFQGDLTYRGYRASPLLGAGQGLSVYLDGVRINEPFGDVVNFDLIPEFSIATLTLVPGANPAFGLNSLGGALAYTTFDGESAPGWRAEVSGGSFGRRRLDLSQGTQYEGGWHSYIAATSFREDGWRDFSYGRLGNLLAKLGHDEGRHRWDLSLLHASSRLNGNGLVPLYGLAQDGTRTPELYPAQPAAIYTYPDTTRSKVTQLSMKWRSELAGQRSFDALAYVRAGDRDTLNSDTADEPTPAYDAALNTTFTHQRGAGLALSLSGKQDAHQWQTGSSLDASQVRYRQDTQPANFTPDRGVVAGGDVPELAAAVRGHSWAFGVYATDTWELAPRTHLTGTARYNRSQVSNRLTSVDETSGEATQRPEESFQYGSLNPALGIAHRLGDGGPTLFANLARNNRVPTVIELGCADPAQPCRLPAGLQSDPYLKQVISTTVEAGARWHGDGVNASLALFRTDNRDDILFRSVSVNGLLGYFQNFPRTRNQGLDAQVTGRVGAFDLSLAYSLLDATYQAEGVLRQGERNVEVRPGTRVAGLPRHTLKAALDWRVQPALSFGVDLQATSRRGSQGNEDGHIVDGTADPVDVSLPGHAVWNLRASWKPASDWELYAKLNNVSDRRYENFGTLGQSVFDAAGHYTGDERSALFVAPGTPRAFFMGVRYRY